jgi:hypothetical protein
MIGSSVESRIQILMRTKDEPIIADSEPESLIAHSDSEADMKCRNKRTKKMSASESAIRLSGSWVEQFCTPPYTSVQVVSGGS